MVTSLHSRDHIFVLLMFTSNFYKIYLGDLPSMGTKFVTIFLGVTYPLNMLNGSKGINMNNMK